MKHPCNIDKYKGSLEELAESIGNLRYDALAEFLELLSTKIATDGAIDTERGRLQLGKCLHDSSGKIAGATKSIKQAWRICEPYMDKEEVKAKR
jgi:hypothetical protein